METSNCLNCENEIKYYKSNSRGKFCNNQCQADYQFKTRTIPLILEGKIDNSDALKRYLRETYGDICVNCKQINIHNGLPLVLQLDHIDGNSDNNQPNNLRLLCPNCHSQTETYCSKQGKKKHKRNRYLRTYKKQSNVR